MEMKRKEKEKGLVGLLEENKYLSELLSGVKKENADIERKIKYSGLEKVVGIVFVNIFCGWKFVHNTCCQCPN